VGDDVTTSTPELDLLTTAGLADFVGVSVPTVKRWRRTGDGPPGFRLSARPGGPVVYRRSVVIEWLERREANAYPPLPPGRFRRAR
jgi:predicted DNA-binding transcriptional regulator AlpA